jgi:Mg-chelatase subunit ChlD
MQFLALSLVLLVSAATPAPRSTRAVTSQQRPRVEVTFVLDTTGSMGGLIDGAKRRIWSIARRIGEGRPRPDLRIGLVAYRDRGDEYVTRVFDLTSDMDQVYQSLMSLQAAGGGDGPEHVSAALHDAVHDVSWTSGHALRVIFLVGDAPPHMDYQDGYDFRRHVREARQRGIGVETIECGADPEAERFWREIADLGAGHFARIDSTGGMPARVTPVDAELARLNGELAGTIVASGAVAERVKAEARIASRVAMPASMAAEAASYFARADRLADKDLVGLPVAEQKKELRALSKSQGDTPAALRGKGEADALAYLQGEKQRRDRIQERILQLQAKRDALLAEAGQSKKADGFDERVVGSLKARAQEAGIAY